MRHGSSEQPALRALARDAGLARLSRLRRWLAIGTLAMVGALAGLVAQARPGKSSGAAPHAPDAAGPAARSSRLPSASGGEATPTPSISPPAQAPLAAPAVPPPPVVSGGS
jgi:hypothetical protein